MGIIVLDIGTSSIRSILYSDQGEKLYTDQLGYSPDYSSDGQVEQSPSDWINGMEKTIGACTAFAAAKGEKVLAVSVTSQRSSVILIDEKNQPIGKAMMWQDKRPLQVFEQLKPYNQRIFELAGSRINPVFSGSKMLWIRQFKPELYKQAKRLVVIPDYVIYQMTGNWVTDATYGSRSLLMNLKERRWDEELLALFQVDKEKLCTLIEPGSIAGYVTKECAARTGLAEATPIITAGGDQQCAALGMGIVTQGSIEISVGTGAYMIAASQAVPDDLREDVVCNASAIPGEYVLESNILSCASVFNWFLGLAYGLTEENKGAVYQLVNQEMTASLEHESDVMILPLFQGRGTPDWNSSAKGCFQNLTLGTSRGDIARAILEGLSYEIAENIETIKKYVGETKNLSACGGLTNSPVFGKILADVSQSCINTYFDNEATAIGAWMSGAVSLGLCPDYQSAFKQVRSGDQSKQQKADETLQSYYQNKRQEYRKLYRQLYAKEV